MSVKSSILYIGGEDVRMRIPMLKKMIKKGYSVGAVGCNDSNAFKNQEISYFDYYLKYA